MSLKRKLSPAGDETDHKRQKLNQYDKDDKIENNDKNQFDAMRFNVDRKYIENCKEIYSVLITMDLSSNCVYKTIAEYAAKRYFKCRRCKNNKFFWKDMKWCDGHKYITKNCNKIYCMDCKNKMWTFEKKHYCSTCKQYIKDRYRQFGYRCEKCEELTEEELKSCSRCGTEVCEECGEDWYGFFNQSYCSDCTENHPDACGEFGDNW